MRVLVVEDDPDLRRQLSEALAETGYAVDLADNGEDGHHLGDTEPYDAVILDLGLPIIDGVTVLERWRRAGREMPVLILTARDEWREKACRRVLRTDEQRRVLQAVEDAGMFENTGGNWCLDWKSQHQICVAEIARVEAEEE